MIVDELDPTISTDSIRLHRLVREIAAGRWERNARETARRTLIEAMAAVYPSEAFNYSNNWPRARRLDALALALIASDTVLPKDAEGPASYLMDELASYRKTAL